jgi:hypothetical protein
VPDHINTMTFDMTTEEGRTAFEYARLGLSSHLVLWKLWSEMHEESNNWDDHPDPTKIVNALTYRWLQRLLELMDYHCVPLDV